MLAESVVVQPETRREAPYNHRSFELVFSHFCDQYSKKIEEQVGAPIDGENRNFLGLPVLASWREMRAKLDEVRALMGEPPELAENLEYAGIKDEILLSARFLAWNTVMGGITQQYIDKLNDHIASEIQTKGLHGSSRKLMFERRKAVGTMLSQNHALRNYFDSHLAKKLGNDSPMAMDRLLSKAPYSDEYRATIVEGLSLEIACRRYLKRLDGFGKLGKVWVDYGNGEDDAKGGDLVATNGQQRVLIDIKSSMPIRFADGESSSPADTEKGYRWMSVDGTPKVVVWASDKQPVASDKFELTDEALARDLQLIVSSVGINKLAA